MDFYVDRTSEERQRSDFSVRSAADRRSGIERRNYQDLSYLKYGPERRRTFIDRRSWRERRDAP